jgi:hypothetical protein
MRKLSKAVFTMMVIFTAAYMLAASGCADSSNSKDVNLNVPTGGNDGQQDSEDLQPLKPEQVRECSENEFVQLVSWRNVVNSANGLIDTNKGKKHPQAVEASLRAINACDSRFAYHKIEPCKKTKKTIISTEVKVYDAYTIKRDCTKVDGYLTKHNLRPQPGVIPGEPQPAPYEPTPQPLPVEPQPPVIDDGGLQGSISACSQDEFSRLTDWAGAQDKANKSIAKLGSQDNWKYDDQAITNAALAVKQCESLMNYHGQRPCEKNIKQDDGSMMKRQYTRQTLGDRCKTSRTYFYEYVQNKTTLIFPNANLYVDLSRFQQQNFEAQSFASLGNCVVENRTDSAINYSGRKALVTETRGFDQKMIVLITAEGLKIDCYGLDIDGAFSKTEVVRRLKAKETDINLEYRLK